MRTEAEIRKHRDDLRASAKISCSCVGTSHERECIEGGLMMAVADRVLTWALGEDSDEYERVVEGLSAGVRRVTK